MKAISLLFCGVALMALTPVLAADWAIKADYTESCSCNVICPCMLGGKPTHDACLGQGMLRVIQGHYGDVDLAGVKAFVTFQMDKWQKYTVSDQATPEQAAALRKVIEASFLTPGSKIIGYKQGPVAYALKDGRITYSTPGSEVELVSVPGSDGKPVRIDNMPGFPEYEQYRSVKNSYQGDPKTFSFSNTNGFTAKLDLPNKD